MGAARNTESPSLSNSLGSSPASNEVSNAAIERVNGQATLQEQDSNASNSQLLSNGLNTNSNRSLVHTNQLHSDLATKNGSRMRDGESRVDTEWVEQDEPVYISHSHTYQEVSRILNEFGSVRSGLVRNKQNNNGQRTGQEYMNNTMYA
ncbi:hypothetical protein CJ030_MR1G006146 [Morella rubra]|uniref:Uncharacterized protein n=1 Tax=Morella rubra TaxID=262757 RepID=A0A6A1WV13_9ROSI|nr:hypothetical protein CJ030_MR1G006146 [Morella rubra]